MRRQLRRARHLAEFAALYGLYLLSRLVPGRCLLPAGRALGRAAWRLVPIRRQVVLANLRASFGGELSEPAIRDLARRFYEHLGTTLLEFFRLGTLGRERILQMVTIEGREHLDACRARGTGALLTSGHLGNWELLGAALAALGYPICYLAKSQSNVYVDRVHNAIRRRAGVGIIGQGAQVKELLYALRRGELVGILADQDAGDGGVFVEFMGRAASVPRGPAYMAWRTGAPLVPCAILRRPDGGHHVVITEPIPVDPAWDEATAVAELTRLHTRRLEAFIRLRPDLYFWVHRRWKTRPPGERAAAATGQAASASPPA